MNQPVYAATRGIVVTHIHGFQYRVQIFWRTFFQHPSYVRFCGYLSLSKAPPLWYPPAAPPTPRDWVSTPWTNHPRLAMANAMANAMADAMADAKAYAMADAIYSNYA